MLCYGRAVARPRYHTHTYQSFRVTVFFTYLLSRYYKCPPHGGEPLILNPSFGGESETDCKTRIKILQSRVEGGGIGCVTTHKQKIQHKCNEFLHRMSYLDMMSSRSAF